MKESRQMVSGAKKVAFINHVDSMKVVYIVKLLVNRLLKNRSNKVKICQKIGSQRKGQNWFKKMVSKWFMKHPLKRLVPEARRLYFGRRKILNLALEASDNEFGDCDD